MADPKIRLKRSAVSGKIPTPDQVPLGELALNTFDAKLYASKNVGIGTTVFAVNPWSVGLGTNTYNTYFTEGNVGISTANPTSKLQVIGDVRIVGTVTATAFVGDGSGLTNISGSGNTANVSASTLVVSGFSTLSSVSAANLTLAGVTTGLNAPGISTFGDVIISDLFLSGITTGLNAPGISTLGFVQHINLNVSGVSTFSGGLNGSEGADLTRLRVTGISTLGQTNTTGFSNAGVSTLGNATATTLNVSGFSTLSSVSAANLLLTGITTGLNAPGISTFGDVIISDLFLSGITTGLNVSGVSTLSSALVGSAVTINGGGINVTGIVTASSFSGNASTATALQTARTFEITGDIVASPISFNGTGNVSLAATIQPNSVALGSDTTGDYVANITGTANQITVTSGTGEGSTPTLSIPNQLTAPQDITVTRDLQINRNLNVNGNITIGGTSATLFTTELKISDPDIILGFRTDGGGNDVSNDNTANHGGVALASTEGTPLVNIFIAGIETNPATYKKIMWFKSGTFAGLNTDAWLINYAVGIGSTQFPTGTRLAAGNVQFTQNDLAVVRNINASGVVTASSFSGNASISQLNVTGFSTLGSISGANLTLAGVTTGLNVPGISTLGFVQHTTLNVSGFSTLGGSSATLLNVSGVSTLSGGVLVSQGADLTRLRVTGITTLGQTNTTGLSNVGLSTLGNATASTLVVSGFSTLGSISGGNLTLAGVTTGLNVPGISTLGSVSNTNLNVSGVSTFSGGLNASQGADLARLRVTGITTLGQTNTTGFSNAGLSTLGNATATTLVVSGFSTLSSVSAANLILAGVTTGLNVPGISTLAFAQHTTLNVSGFSTLGSISGGNLTLAGVTTGLNVPGISTLGSVSNTNLSVSGVSTFSGGLNASQGADLSRLRVTGITTLGQTNTTGFSNAGLSTLGNATAITQNVSGFSTLGSISGANLILAGITTGLNVPGISTFGDIVTSDLFLSGITTGLNAPGISTLAFVQQTTLNVSGASTFSSKVEILQDSGSNNRFILRGQPASLYRWNIDNFGSSNDFRIFREDDATAANGSVAVSISTIGTLTATKFSGDGSLLTNLPGGSGSSQWVTTSVGIHTLSNVGIGTTNPTSKLTVSGSASITGILTADQVYTSNNGTGQNIRIGDDLWIGDINVSNTTRFSGAQDSTKAFIVFGTSDTVALGRTGFGPLYYGGDFTISGVATANSFRARGGAPGALGVNNNGYGFFGSGDNDSGMYSSADGQIEFYTNSTEAIRIDSNQRVGISTTNPTSKLHVLGDVLVTSGVSTFSGGLNASQGADLARLRVTGITTLGQTNTTGLSNAGLSTLGNATASTLVVSGFSTLGSISGGNLTLAGVTTGLNVPGISTLGFVQHTTLRVTGVSTVGVVTGATSIQATNFYGDGSQLTGIAGGVSISTNTANSNQYIPYATSFGSTTGFGATTLLVYNPSSGNLGIGTTNPTTTLQVQGSTRITGITSIRDVTIDKSIASPNATVPVAIIGVTTSGISTETNIDVVLLAKGTGATLAQVPDGTAAGGNKRGTYATDLQKIRTTAAQVASANGSVISGGQDNIASGQWSVIGGGLGNTVSNTSATISGGNSNSASGNTATIAGGGANQATSSYSFVGGGQSNTAQTSTHATVCGGSTNTASGTQSTVGGGISNVASGGQSTVAGGNSNTASGVTAVVGGGLGNTASASRSIVAGGESNTASGGYSFVGGGVRGTTRSIVGNHVFAACNIPIADVSGVSQSALLLLARQTTDATATVLASNQSAATTTNQVILPNNSAYFFKGSCIAGVTGAGDTKAWEFKGAIKRGANAAATSIVGSVIKDVIASDSGASAWDITITADTTNGGIAVTVTGQASTTIRWVCKIETTEMTY